MFKNFVFCQGSVPVLPAHLYVRLVAEKTCLGGFGLCLSVWVEILPQEPNVQI
jgi:hypothetical protein